MSKAMLIVAIGTISIGAATRPSRPPEIIAHRGESWLAPENTLAAFNLAWKRGADAVELDVHLTADGHLIVCHDDNTERTTGRKLVIRQSTLAELRTLDAGAWKGARMGRPETSHPGGSRWTPYRRTGGCLSRSKSARRRCRP